MWRKLRAGSNERSSRLTEVLIKTGLLLALITVFRDVPCEAKEFDWNDLGVSLAGPRTYSNVSSNNLRILVSPQRRTTKNYEFDFNNTSQQAPGQNEASYVIPGSSGSAYLSPTVGQLAPSQPGHSTAYSALSASLASLKNRLNARGVSLTGPMSDQAGQSTLYSGGGSSYGSSVLVDPQQQHQQQQAPQQQAQQQPTYLSVASPDQNGVYSTAQNQSNENKTIVLAIPAKINFLTDNRSSGLGKQQQHQQQQVVQQPQQLAVLQPSIEQSATYSGKQQIGVLGGQDASIEQSTQIVNRSPNSDTENPQYVLVNSSPAQASDHPHLIATPEGVSQAQGPLYSNLYSAVPQANLNSYSMKYVTAYQPAAVQQPPVQKIYQTVDPNASYDSQSAGDQSGPMATRYASCPDTCVSSDPRWRKYTVSKYKYCCSRSVQYDSQFEHPSADKVNDASTKFADDGYYSYLYRRARARRSKRPSRQSRHRYSPAPVEDDGSSADSGSSDSVRSTSGRYGHHTDSPYMKYYKSRQQPADSEAVRDEIAPPKPPSKERSYRRGRARDYDANEPQSAHEATEDEGAYPSREQSRSPASYGNGEYSIESGRYPSEPRVPAHNDEEEGRPSFEDSPDAVSRSVAESPDYTSPDSSAESIAEEPEPETTIGHKHASGSRRKKYGKGRGSRRLQTGRESGKYSKKARKGKSGKLDQSSNQANGTDYESAQAGDLYQYPESNGQSEDEQASNQKESSGAEMGDAEKDTLNFANKYKHSLNDSTVANLSKTTMHLKEILSLLEKKAQSRANESLSSRINQPVTSTPAPPTTTTGLYSSQLSGSQYTIGSLPSSLSSEYLSSDFSLKSPYRFEPSSFSSSLGSSGLSLSPSSYSPLTADYSPLTSYNPSHYGFGPSRHLSMPSGHHPRKRRVNKNLKYSSMMLPKTHGLVSTQSLLQAASKSPLLNPAYYSSLQYPYWYPRSTSASVTNSYPYKNLNKSPYSTLLNGPMSSKFAAAASGALYSDESRYHGLSGYDPLSNVASSLRPSTTMRLRSKPFVLQPQVLPIYTRHTILAPPLDVKK